MIYIQKTTNKVFWHYKARRNGIYYKKHASAFDYPSPATHFSQFVNSAPLAHHTEWIDDVHQNIPGRITFDNDMLPTTDALLLYWKRSCWVLHMWAQADRNTMALKPLTDYGLNLTIIMN